MVKSVPGWAGEATAMNRLNSTTSSVVRISVCSAAAPNSSGSPGSSPAACSVKTRQASTLSVPIRPSATAGPRRCSSQASSTVPATPATAAEAPARAAMASRPTRASTRYGASIGFTSPSLARNRSAIHRMRRASGRRRKAITLGRGGSVEASAPRSSRIAGTAASGSRHSPAMPSTIPDQPS